MALPDDVVGEAFRSDLTWETLEALADVGNRMAGQPGEAEGARVMRSALERAGAREATITEFEISGWWRGSSTLRLTDGERERTYGATHEVLALPGTPAGTVEAPLVDVGDGVPASFERADLEGAIAVVGSQNPPDTGRAINRIEKYARAVRAGAAAFVYRNDVTDGGVPPTGAVGFGHDFPAAIPAVGVSREVGATIERFRRDGDARAALTIDCRSGPATSRNVEALVGPATGREVLVTAHVDAHDVAEGARDNGVGCALVAEVARILARVEDDLAARVRLVVFGGEETGLFGSRQWVRERDLDDVAALVYVDGIGFTRSLLVAGLGPVDEAVTPVAEDLHVPIETDTEVHPFSDTWPFVSRGVPCLRCISTAGDEGQVKRYGGLEWGHTHSDTIDKLDPRDLRDLAIQVAGVVAELAGVAEDLDRLEDEAVRAELPADLADYLELDDRWPW